MVTLESPKCQHMRFTLLPEDWYWCEICGALRRGKNGVWALPEGDRNG